MKKLRSAITWLLRLCQSVETRCSSILLPQPICESCVANYYEPEERWILDEEVIWAKVVVLRTLQPVPESLVERSLFFCEPGTDAEVQGYFSESITDYVTIPVVPMLGADKTFACFMERWRENYAGHPSFQTVAVRLTRDEWHALVAERDEDNGDPVPW